MGEARKRKVSEEKQANGTKPQEVKIIEKSGGLGLIPVVLISAILAGSGCHVLKKDTTQNINELTTFVNELKANNAQTAELVSTLRSTIQSKDNLINSLKKDIAANEEQTKQTDKKMDTIISELKDSEAASQARNEKIKDLETKLSATKTEAESKIENLNSLISSLPSGIQDDLVKQGVEIEQFQSKIAALDSRVTEQDAKIASTAEKASKVPNVEDLMSATISGLQNQIENLKNDVIDASAKIPSEVTLVNIKTQAEKASSGLKEAMDEITQHTKDINNLKSAGEKQLSGLSDSVQTLTNDSVGFSSSIKKMTSDLESAQSLLQALSNDIDSIKKRQADLAKGA